MPKSPVKVGSRRVEVRRTRHRSRRRRLIADFLVLAGLLVLLYPLGTWGYTWWEQRALERRLEQDHPVLAGNAASYFSGELVDMAGEDARREEAASEAEEADDPKGADELKAFSQAARAFAEQGSREGEPMGKLLIPRIEAEAVLIHGTTGKDLREGPGHWPETPVPGQGGNFVVSGHRTTYGAPFFKLDKLTAGDEIDVVLPYAAIRYRVTRSTVVRPDQVETVAQRGVEEISLTTCHPIYSASKRLVVQAELESFRLLDPGPPGQAQTQSSK